MPQNVPLLLDDQPILLYRNLAVKIGINQAAILQQLHYLINTQKQARNRYNFVVDRWWVYNSYNEWRREHFPWLSEAHIKRLFGELEDMNIVLSMQSVKTPSDRRKWYTIDYEEWAVFAAIPDAVSSDQNDPISDQNDPIIGSKCSDGYSETPSETLNKYSSANADREEKSHKSKPKKSPSKESSESTNDHSAAAPRVQNPLFNAVGTYFFSGSSEAGWAIAKIVNGDKAQGRCRGILAYEAERAGQGQPPTLDDLAALIPGFSQWCKDDKGLDELRDCAKWMVRWDEWRNRLVTPNQDDDPLLDDPLYPGTMMSQSALAQRDREYLFIEQMKRQEEANKK